MNHTVRPASAILLLVLTTGLGAQDRPRLADALALEEAMQEAIKRAEPSIACILVSRADDPTTIDLANPDRVPESYGSGVVIDEKGLILTNRHVVLNATALYVRLPGGKGGRAEIHAADWRSDLAVLRLLDARVLPAIKMGDGGAVRKGQFVLSLANPFAVGFRDGSPSASWGILSNLRRRAPGNPKEEERDKTLHEYGTLLQTDARLNLGCSGGALIDLKGELIGLTTATAAIVGGETPGGYAIPLDAGMRRIIEVLKRGEEVEYGFLGIGFPQKRDLPRGQGMSVNSVVAGSPAAAAGLRPGDVILKLNGTPINDPDDLFLTVGTHLAGSRVDLEVRSLNGTVRVLPVTLAKFHLPEKMGKVIASKRPPAPGGLRVDWTSILAQRVGTGLFGGAIPAGVVIREVQTNSAADRVRLQPDKVITHVNGRAVSMPAEFYREMELEIQRGAGPVELTLYHPEGRTDKVKLDLR